MNEFNETLKRCPEQFQQALIDVCDTAYLCKLWFDAYAPNATATDIVKLTELVLQRERALSPEDTP